MEALVNRRSDLRLRFVDIADWGSEVAQQYRVRQLPTLWMYTDGRQVASDTDGTVHALNDLK